LNETQRKKLVQALRSGTKLGAALQTLNLNADQKQKIGAIVQKSNQEVKATLTPKQQQQLETMRKQHQTATQAPIE
jgi:Spy/CpxP family protein refolding chaperone